LIQASPSAAPRVRLLDFGLARPLETRAGSVGPETRTGAIVGTLGYMAPEVLAGSPASVRSDLFSVGVVGYELLAGRRPFDGATVVAQHEQMSRGPARPLESIVPGIPPALADTIASLLRPEPADRPASAGAVRERLASLREV
jgi:serine/threonine protein kinase